jgi:hypothetical protein
VVITEKDAVKLRPEPAARRLGGAARFARAGFATALGEVAATTDTMTWTTA